MARLEPAILVAVSVLPDSAGVAGWRPTTALPLVSSREAATEGRGTAFSPAPPGETQTD